MGVSGDEQDPFKFHKQYSEGGTTLWRFYEFMHGFIEWLAGNRPGHSFCFTIDNMNIRKHPSILNLIGDNAHKVVFRALYWLCDGAIEYVFNTIQTKLQMDYEGVTHVDDLILKIDDIILKWMMLNTGDTLIMSTLLRMATTMTMTMTMMIQNKYK